MVSCGVVCVILCLAVLVEHRLVTDTDTDTDTDGHRPYSTADGGTSTSVLGHFGPFLRTELTEDRSD